MGKTHSTPWWGGVGGVNCVLCSFEFPYREAPLKICWEWLRAYGFVPSAVTSILDNNKLIHIKTIQQRLIAMRVAGVFLDTG